MTRIRNFWAPALVLGALTLTAPAQSGRPGGYRGYATDSFEGFEALEQDTRIPQKEKSFWYSVKHDDPQQQLDHAAQMEACGRFRAARKAYEALVREWPTTPQAAQSQLAIAQLREKTKKFERAFDEYQYLLTHYAGHCPYDEILDRQFRIANHLLHNNRSMFGWALSGTESIRERFEQIVRNAPRSAIAPEVMLIIGSIRVSAKERREAIAVYDSLLNRFPNSEQAMTAAYLAAQCRHELAVRFNYNETRCREAVAFLKAILSRIPNHPQKDQLKAWQTELVNLLVEQNYQQAFFYDSRTRNRDAAIAAYRRFLSEFSDSKYARQVRARLSELEAGAPPAK
ncbi:MAG: tetratricopeptide repeat protein [Kiritimatiellae bacterium]|nr:tetratricopeptide repeat protein [Kiritimatiellia bacterium]MDD3543731.1 tetratricopeptide repeat protein [Kiritimatiellia bacterium]MDD4026508.1 tetratricopeptide repeat protein [Kiritimatiellia bacterium]MDD4623450.1 tetratricopeptide repeat protein [Kiritimatiellia bacterium]